MRLTDEQFNALLPYQQNFETMLRSNWARHPGTAALDLIHEIYCNVTGSTRKLNKGCSHCIMQLLEDMGRIFLADLEERNKRKVAVKDSATTDPGKVEVRTKRRSTRRKKDE